LTVKAALVPRFYPLLQAGFFLRARVGVSVGVFLREQLGLSDRYVEERVSTVFLDGKPVDDLGAAILEEGSRLALSSAMPGLVGATMRRKGFYASLRGTITHHAEGQAPVVKEGTVFLKLFNLVMSDIGPDLLARGILLPSRDLSEFFKAQGDLLLEGCLAASVDGRPFESVALRQMDGGGDADLTEIRVCGSK
jgi:hypothetical protein